MYPLIRTELLLEKDIGRGLRGLRSAVDSPTSFDPYFGDK